METSAVVASMGTAFTTIQGDMLEAIGVIAPIALTVFGAVIIWRFGLKFFKSVTGK